MKGRALVAALMLAACSPQGEPAAPASEALPSDAAPAVRLDPAALVGGWSFDRTCASEDAMGLMPDDKAYFDEWGQGAWEIDADGRLVLTLRELTPGVEDDGGGEQVVMTLTAREHAGDRIVGELSSPRANIPAREINALKCPEHAH